MEDKRTAIALFLCIVFIMLYSQLFITPMTEQRVPAVSPSQGQTAPAAGSQQQPAAPAVSPGSAQQVAPAAFAPVSSMQHPSRADLEAAGFLNVESPNVSLSLSLLGGRLSRYELKNYKEHVHAEELVNMVHAPESGPLPLGVTLGTSQHDGFVQYSLTSTDGVQSGEGSTFVVPLGNEATITLNGTLPNGIGIQKIFKLRLDTYMFDVDVRLSQPSADGTDVWLEWARFVSDSELHDGFDPLQYTLLSGSTGKIQHLLLKDIYPGNNAVFPQTRELGDNSWLALTTKYFMAALIPAQSSQLSRVVFDRNSFLSRVQGTPNGAKFSLYVGPKDYRILKELGFNLHRTIDLGIFSFLAFPLISAIRFFEYIFGNYGLAIILLTLLIKTLFLPLTKASMDSMRAMQEIQPEVKALRERIKDATQLNQEMLALYKRKGVNPMGGCLPVLIQIPVFLGLYNALLYSIELRHAPFALWIDDLSAKEQLVLWGVPVPVMILLMGASMYFQQMTSPQPSMDPTQRKILMMMPIFLTITFIIFPFPSGLVLYWLVNNIISITQQVYLRSHKKASPLIATVVASICIFCFGFVLTLLS